MPAPLAPSDRILVVRLGAVGDVIRTLPAVRWIRHSFPSVPIAWVVEDLSRDLIIGHPDVDEVIRFPRRELRPFWTRPREAARALRAFARHLRARRFTVAADFQGSLKSALVAMLSGADRRIGFAPGHSRECSWLLTNEWVRPPVRRLNRVARNLLLASALGASDDEVAVFLPEHPEDRVASTRMLRGLFPAGGRVVVLSPGTSRRQRRKRWPAEHYARLASLMSARLAVSPLVVWGPGEEEMARRIAGDSGGAALPAPPIGLRLLGSVLRRADLFIGADTGPMHLAWAVGCPVVAVFGPTDPALNAPLGRRTVVLRDGRSAAAVTPEAVLDAAQALLEAALPRQIPDEGVRMARASLLPGPVGAP